jgi:hypothetical protein
MKNVRWFVVVALLGAWTLAGGLAAQAGRSAAASEAAQSGRPGSSASCIGGGACSRTRACTVVRAGRVTVRALGIAARATVESLHRVHSGS